MYKAQWEMENLTADRRLLTADLASDPEGTNYQNIISYFSMIY